MIYREKSSVLDIMQDMDKDYKEMIKEVQDIKGSLSQDLNKLEKYTERLNSIETSLGNLENEVNDLKEGNVDIDIDLTNYVTKNELSLKVDKETGKSLISDTEIERLSTLKNYDDTDIKNTLNSKANKTELHSHSNKSVLDGISSAKVTEWNNKSTFSGNYNDLTNKPIIPTLNGYATEQYVNEEIKKIDVTEQLTDYAKKSELHGHSNKSVLDGITSSKVTEWNNKSTFDGNYNNLTNKPTIPTKTSQLTNDSGYLTKHQDISHKADKTELHSHNNKSVIDEITSTKITEWNNKSDFSGSYNDLTNKPTIPSKTSQLINDNNFLTSIPSEYVTESELHISLKELQANLNSQTPQFVNSIEECVDTTKLYVLPDGYIYAYMYTEKTETVKGYTNKLPSAIDTDGSIYNGCGYKNGWRINSSRVEKEQSGCGITGFIKVNEGDVIRAENYGICTQGYQYIVLYNSNFGAAGANKQDTVWLTTGKLEYTIPTNAGIRYARLSLGEFTSSSIITINEEIKETTSTTKKYEWTNTNQKFIQGNYDEEINELEVKVNKNTSDIEILKNNQTVNSNTVMYVSPLGNDNNNGLTEDKPKLTFQACIDVGATKISAKRGIYKKGISKVINNNDVEIEIYPTDNNKNRDIGETFDPIVIDLSDEILATDFIPYNSIKRVAYSNSNNVPIKKVFVDKTYKPQYSNGSDYGSRWNSSIWLLSDDEKTVHKLKPVLTVAECENTTGTFTYDGSYIYANADWTNITKVNVPYDYYTGILLQGFSKIKLTEVEVRFTGSYCFDLKACPNVELHKCSSKYTLYGSGFHPYNVNGVFKNCYATKCYDGFGISAAGHTTYIDCISEFNFDDGASNHNTSEGTFIGGRYEGNGKAGNAPAYGCKVNIIGGLYKNNSIGIGYLSATGEGHADGMIQSAIIVGNTTGLAVNKDCNVICTTSYFEGNTTQKDIKGTFTEYGNTIK